jgi:hypothetical protein
MSAVVAIIVLLVVLNVVQASFIHFLVRRIALVEMRERIG